MAVNHSVPPCEVQVDAVPLSGVQNMDRDAALLQRVAEDPSRSVVRIYQWDEPTVSLGYFQKPDDDIDSRLVNCPRVRRITGGGAILHDDELTYSCVLPSVHPRRAMPTSVYPVVHAAIIRLMFRCGAEAAMRKDLPTAPAARASTEPFLCFLRSDPHDVVLQGHKVLGSAQRRRRGTILQHGSILLRASLLTPEIPGIFDLCPEFDFHLFERELPGVIASALVTDISC